MASVSPKHDTHPLLVASGEFAVSILAGDQVDVGQYFSYPGRKFRYIVDEYLETIPATNLPVVRNCIAWLRCETFEVKPMGDHNLFFARVVDVGPGRLKEPPLLYSSRLGWRITGDKARAPGRSIRDELLERLAAAGFDAADEPDDDEA
jgi:flavin reductase (DIM6/NTAB) family NADH-FMN oxidoreductase RutF